MKRLINLIILSLVLLTACNKEEIRPTEIKVEIESVSGSRARFTVAPESSHAYYSYVLVKESDPNYNESTTAICNNEILEMVKALPFFESGSFTDIFCFRGSRQFTMNMLEDDKDFKFIVFQINPKTYKLIGNPVVCNFHTKPVPDRDLHFDVNFDGDMLTITPSDDHLTYVWEYEESELISDIYVFAPYYLYKVVEMYQEYGFLDMLYMQGPSEWDFSLENNMNDGTEYTIAISGCEEGEFTTPVTVVRFLYHPGNIELLEVSEGSYDKSSSEPQSELVLRYSQHQNPIPCITTGHLRGARNNR
jgi:hypothetical protein